MTGVTGHRSTDPVENHDRGELAEGVAGHVLEDSKRSHQRTTALPWKKKQTKQNNNIIKFKIEKRRESVHAHLRLDLL